MTEYIYTDKVSSPNSSQILIDIENSIMFDKQLEYCHWDSETQILKIYFKNQLKPSDKLILDDIVFENS